MSSAHRGALLLLATLALAAGFSACSFILNFTPDGQPCAKVESDGGAPLEQCLSGFKCSNHVCVRQHCDTGTAFSDSAGACLSTRCASTICPVGQTCQDNPDGGVSACTPVSVPGAIGAYCYLDSDCNTAGASSTRVCLHGAVAADPTTGGLRPGVCVEPCSGSARCSDGSTCQTFVMGDNAGSTSFCLPQATPCASTADCAQIDPRLVCTVFDHPMLGPTTFCDFGLVGGAAVGGACTTTAQTGLSFCADGLCTPPNPNVGQAAACAETCGSAGCADNTQRCVLGELDFAGSFRHVPLCVKTPTNCADCTDKGDADCGPDGPHCTQLGATAHCLLACTPASGQVPACPNGYTCATPTGATAGVFRCLPPNNLCPGQ